MFIPFVVGILLIQSLPSTGQILPEAAPSSADQARKITYSSTQSNPLSSLIAIASAHQIPLGLILGQKPLLCAAPRSVNVHDADALIVLAEVVKGTGYTISLENGVYIVTAPDVSERQKVILSHRFSSFTTSSRMDATAQYLNGMIAEAVDGAKGFVLNIISTPGEKTVTTGTMENTTSKEVANRVAVQGNNGVWIMEPSGAFQIFDYGRDAGWQAQLTCSGWK